MRDEAVEKCDDSSAQLAGSVGREDAYKSELAAVKGVKEDFVILASSTLICSGQSTNWLQRCRRLLSTLIAHSERFSRPRTVRPRTLQTRLM